MFSDLLINVSHLHFRLRMFTKDGPLWNHPHQMGLYLLHQEEGQQRHDQMDSTALILWNLFMMWRLRQCYNVRLASFSSSLFLAYVVHLCVGWWLLWRLYLAYGFSLAMFPVDYFIENNGLFLGLFQHVQSHILKVLFAEPLSAWLYGCMSLPVITGIGNGSYQLC